MPPFAKRSLVVLALLATFAGASMRLGPDRASAAATATFSVNAPAGAQPLDTPFTVTVELSGVTFDAASTFWAAYDVELDFNTSMIQVGSVTPGICPPQDWKLINPSPIHTGCGFQVSTTASGILETISMTCVADGVSALSLPAPLAGMLLAGNQLVDFYGVGFAMTLNDGSVACGTGITGPTRTPTIGPTPTATATAGPFVQGSGAFAVTVPASAQPLDLPFAGSVDLTAFSPSVSQPQWAGYSLEVDYDSTIVEISDVQPTALCPAGHGGPTAFSGPSRLVLGCWGMRSESTGAVVTMSVRCLKNGSTTIHFVQDGGYFEFFDWYARYFALTAQDRSVVCDQSVDQDGDACVNASETALGLDPTNPWDFYDVPAPALLSAPDPPRVFRDGVIAASDAQAVFGYFAAGAHVGMPIYDQDLDGNGVPDGLEYDRSVLGPAQSGPPDGYVTPQDAQLVFAQFKLGYRC